MQRYISGADYYVGTPLTVPDGFAHSSVMKHSQW